MLLRTYFNSFGYKVVDRLPGQIVGLGDTYFLADDGSAPDSVVGAANIAIDFVFGETGEIKLLRFTNQFGLIRGRFA